VAVGVERVLIAATPGQQQGQEQRSKREPPAPRRPPRRTQIGKRVPDRVADKRNAAR
jgi:hypothetical protein